jgi:HEAT repeat protein
LGEILRKDKPAIRVAAARALGLACGYPDRIPLLVEALKDPDAWVRESAATALGAYPAPAALPHLLAALDDTQPKVCQSAVDSLRKYGPNAVEPLMARVRAIRPEHPTPEFEVLAGLPPALIETALARDLASPEPALRLLAMRLAAYICSAQGPKPMPGVLHSIAANLKDAQADIRAGAADALGCMPSEGLLPILAEAVTNDPAATVRAAAATAFGYTWRVSWFARSLRVHPCPAPDTRGLESLLTAVADKDPDVRLASLRAIEFLVDGKIMPLRLEAIMGVMDDPRTDVRVAAARVLVRCPSALQEAWTHAVERGLRNDQWQVRREWTEVLGQYGYPQALVCAKDPAEHAEVRLAALRGIERDVQDGKSMLKAPQYRLAETLNSIWADASSPADVRSAAKNVWYKITPCAAARANSQEMTP